jgi:hypothetical protein
VRIPILTIPEAFGTLYHGVDVVLHEICSQHLIFHEFSVILRTEDGGLRAEVGFYIPRP